MPEAQRLCVLCKFGAINTQLKAISICQSQQWYMPALKLVKEALSDDIFLIVASELIVNVPSYLA